MHEILADIVRRKRVEMAEAKDLVPLAKLAAQERAFAYRSQLKQRLQNVSLPPAIIAEIKIASPTHESLGSLDEIAARALAYERARADAISFITEKHYFKS